MTQEKAIELALQGHNIFLTGQAGTGKSYTLNKLIEIMEMKGKVVAKTASTGIASTHINGQTIHSWSGVGIRRVMIDDDMYKLKNNSYFSKRLCNTDVLIIDEISMLDGNTLGLIENVCRFVIDKTRIFGGLQVIVCGDFYQLPPVNKSNSKDDYCFLSEAWRQTGFKTCYLEKIYRQQNDSEFIELLNAIRNDSVHKDHHDMLKALEYNKEYVEQGINLYCTNKNVSTENTMQLQKLPGESYVFRYEGKGDPEWKLDALKKNILAEETLMLKIGAKIMILVNDTKGQYVNGTLCKVTDIEYEEDEPLESIIQVEKFCDGRRLNICMNTWKMTENDGTGEKTLAKFIQFPLKLAWSLTVHKSQGATFDYLNLDLRDVFTHNMGYVALSRCTTLAGIYLAGYNNMTLHIDPVVREFDNECRIKSKEIGREVA